MKRLKIGEYAIGGIVDIEVGNNDGTKYFTVKFRDWGTKEVVKQCTFVSESKSEVEIELSNHTSSYYACKIIEEAEKEGFEFPKKAEWI